MEIKTIDAITLKGWLDTNEAVLVDVREPAEYRAEKIPGAVSIPLSAIPDKSCCSLVPKTDKKIVLQCLGGKRSAMACEKFIKDAGDNRQFYNLAGGINSWKELGLATVSGEKKIIPIDRQAQIGAGLVVLLGLLLGATVNSGFLWLSAFVGCGLIFAGVTGTCLLALLLAKMPWNK